MATVTVTPACNNSITQNFTFEDNGNHLRDASFSSYLVSSEEAFTLKLGESTRPPLSATVAAAESPHQSSFGRKYAGDREIGIFGAEKYFSGRMDEAAKAISEMGDKQQLKKDVKIDVPQPVARKVYKSAMPSTCSEASWNSQSALLQKERLPNIQKQMSGKRFFVSFGCNCAGKESVDIGDKVGKSRNSSQCKKIVDLAHLGEEVQGPGIFAKGPVGIGQAPNKNFLNGSKQNRLESDQGAEMDCRVAGFKRESCSAFPNLNPAVAVNLTAGKKFIDEEARFSLEVFGAHRMKGMDSSLEKRLTMLTMETGHPIKNIPANSRVRNGMDDEDRGSDASSDLFEIESLTGKPHHSFFHLQPSDDMSSHYEPSEASIEWSTVTASAANFSVASDYDNHISFDKTDLESMITMTTATTTKIAAAKAAAAKESQRPISLLGCRSSKAVKVVANAHRVAEKPEFERSQLRSDSIAPLGRRLTDYESKQAFAVQSFDSRHTPKSLYMY